MKNPRSEGLFYALLVSSTGKIPSRTGLLMFGRKPSLAQGAEQRELMCHFYLMLHARRAPSNHENVFRFR
jgi:hypothetical protein